MVELFKLFAWSTDPIEESNKGLKSRCEHYVRLRQDKRAAGILCVHFMYEESLATLKQYVEKMNTIPKKKGSQEVQEAVIMIKVLESFNELMQAVSSYI